VRDRVANGKVRAVFLVEPEEAVIFDNMIARNRGIAERTEMDLRIEARAKWLYGQWIVDEAHRYGLPVLEVRPWETLVERIVATSSS